MANNKKLSPLQQIKCGIETANWSLVVKGYNQLTGERAKEPQQKNNEQALLRILDVIEDYIDIGKSKNHQAEKVVVEEDDPEEDEDQKDHDEPSPLDNTKHSSVDIDMFTHIQKGTRKESEEGEKRPCRVEPIKVGKFTNGFKPAGQCKEDIKIDKILTKNLVPSERRPPSIDIEVVCCKCNKKSFVTGSLAGSSDSSFVCDKCIKRNFR